MLQSGTTPVTIALRFMRTRTDSTSGRFSMTALLARVHKHTPRGTAPAVVAIITAGSREHSTQIFPLSVYKRMKEICLLSYIHHCTFK